MFILIMDFIRSPMFTSPMFPTGTFESDYLSKLTPIDMILYIILFLLIISEIGYRIVEPVDKRPNLEDG